MVGRSWRYRCCFVRLSSESYASLCNVGVSGLSRLASGSLFARPFNFVEGGQSVKSFVDPRLSTIGCASPSFWCCLELRAHVLIRIGEDGEGPQVVKGSTQSKIVKNV